jgi:hypothetical protein
MSWRLRDLMWKVLLCDLCTDGCLPIASPYAPCKVTPSRASEHEIGFEDAVGSRGLLRAQVPSNVWPLQRLLLRPVYHPMNAHLSRELVSRQIVLRSALKVFCILAFASCRWPHRITQVENHVARLADIDESIVSAVSSAK